MQHTYDHEHHVAAIAMPPQCYPTDRGISHLKRTQPCLQVVLDIYAARATRDARTALTEFGLGVHILLSKFILGFGWLSPTHAS